jgi:hypothetical protein
MGGLMLLQRRSMVFSLRDSIKIDGVDITAPYTYDGGAERSRLSVFTTTGVH